MLRARSMGRDNNFALLAFGALLMATLTLAVINDEQQHPKPSNTWIVELKQAPVLTYTGGIPGIAATKPPPGAKINPRSAGVVKIAAYLHQQGIDAVSRAGGAAAVTKITAHYKYALAGFAIANPTSEELAALQKDPSIQKVTRGAILKPATFTTPSFLGLNAPGGAWAQLGGVGASGEGVIIGVVDSGIWPEHPSFSDTKEFTRPGTPAYVPLPAGKWNGLCEAGEQFDPAVNCNQKLIGCRFFVQNVMKEQVEPGQQFKDAFPTEYFSCRGAVSHGSHTAGTAAGNFGVPLNLPGLSFAKASGIAPRARIAAYKVCWGDVGCYVADIMSAVDQAVADGVDVITFSIADSNDIKFLNPAEKIFFNAAAAGVFVAAAAGNDGPSLGSVANIAPWVTTVAASTHDRPLTPEATVTLGNKKVYKGVPSQDNMLTAKGPAPLVLGEAVARAGVPRDDARECLTGALDPKKAAKKIVVCDNVGETRTAKSQEVARAGGIGMILLTFVDALFWEQHVIPTLQLNAFDRAAVRAYATKAGGTAALSAAKFTTSVAPQMAQFSSRGPILDGGSNLLKPDITGPGVNVYAAVTPAEYDGANFAAMSGTSMSTPHVAGVAALLKQKYPTWSPMAIKSAIMTTAYQTTQTGSSTGQVFGTAFDFGAGHVHPTAALNPGLVIDSNSNDWRRFLCGAGVNDSATTCPECTANRSLCDVHNFNYPSVAIGRLVGSKTFTRVVKNVLPKSTSFTTSFTLPKSGGFTLTANPSSFTLKPGATQVVKIKITSDKKVYNLYTQGAITWKSKSTNTRMPIVALFVKA